MGGVRSAHDRGNAATRKESTPPMRRLQRTIEELIVTLPPDGTPLLCEQLELVAVAADHEFADRRRPRSPRISVRKSPVKAFCAPLSTRDSICRRMSS